MAHHDALFNPFLEKQEKEGRVLATSSDLFQLTPLEYREIPAAYLVRFNCLGLLHHAGQVVEHDDFLVGIRFPDDYLCRFDTAQVLTWLEPFDVWHPNIRPPFICAGRMQPGTPLVDLIYQLYEIITYQNVEMREDNALNRDACSWARNNLHRLPVDRRSLKHRLRAQED